MAKIEQHDIETAQYILSILKMSIGIVASWGLDPKSIKPIKTGIEFHVQGFKHTGMVQVTLNEGADLFELSLITDSGEVTKIQDSIYLDNLISTIDEAVEKTDDYEKRISEEYPFLQNPENPEKVKPMEIIIL